MAPARELAGVNTCRKFTNNNNESIIRVIKEFTGHKKSEWPVFHVRMKELVDSQDHEFQKAIFGQGEYNIHPTYRYLAISPVLFASLTKEERLLHIQEAQRQSMRSTSALTDGS